MTESKRDKRLRQLVELLHAQDKMHLKYAADSLSVSEMTIRRDLSEPHKSLIVIGGYIINKQAKVREPDYVFNEQSSNNVSKKSTLGRIAASQVKQNDMIYFDNGTTIVHIIHAIDENISFTGVCSSLNVFLALKNKENCNAILCGGQFDAKCNHFYPLTECNELANIRFDLMFVSAAGVDLEQGITCYALTEIAYKRRAMKQSQRIMLVVDSSKIGKVRKAFVCSVGEMDEILCDEDLPISWQQQIGHKKRG